MGNLLILLSALIAYNWGYVCKTKGESARDIIHMYTDIKMFKINYVKHFNGAQNLLFKHYWVLIESKLTNVYDLKVYLRGRLLE